MPEEQHEPESGQTQPEAARILIPSALGYLGIELLGEVVNRVLIVPIGRQRKLFTPLAELKRGHRNEFLDEVIGRFSEFLDEVIGRFSEFLAGARKRLDLDYDLSSHDLPRLNRRVLKETARVPYGRTRTYQQIASAAGRPSAYRQVLAVLQTNPLPLVIPCHRVVTTKSGIGSYIAGTKRKSWLIRMEQKNLPLL